MNGVGIREWWVRRVPWTLCMWILNLIEMTRRSVCIGIRHRAEWLHLRGIWEIEVAD